MLSFRLWGGVDYQDGQERLSSLLGFSKYIH